MKKQKREHVFLYKKALMLRLTAIMIIMSLVIGIFIMLFMSYFFREDGTMAGALSESSLMEAVIREHWLVLLTFGAIAILTVFIFIYKESPSAHTPHYNLKNYITKFRK